MSKKRNRPKHKSARGHVEGNVIRWREELKKERYRLDENGKRIKQSPINTFDKNWLVGHLNPEVSAPPTIPMKEPPPNNVTSIADARSSKASKPEPQPGNEAKKQTQKFEHGWLHNKSLAISEFKQWSRLSNEIGRGRCGSEPWVKNDKGKLSSPSLEKQRELSKQGHTRLKFKQVPSSVHNPFINTSGGYAPDNKAAPISKLNQRNRIRAGTETLAPSGIPISEFVTGKFKPIKNAVVYTADQPPTASKHWQASNDHDYDRSVKVRKTTGIRTDYMRLTGQVQWYVDNVDVQKWPLPMYRFVKFNPHKDKPTIDHQAIDKVAGDPQAELNVIKAMLHGMQRQYRMIDIALCDATSENNLLRQELELTKRELASERQANNLMEYHIAQSNGEDPDTVREKYVIKSKTPVTDDADQLLSQFNLFNSFVKFDGLESAFTRYVYGDPKLGQTIREHADARLNDRLSLFNERESLRRIGSNVKQRIAAAGYTKYPEIKKFREKAALYRIRNNIKNAQVDDSSYAQWWKFASDKKSSIYYSRLKYRQLSRDITMIHHWGVSATPFNRKKPVNYQQVINDIVGVRSVEYSKPSLVDYYHKLGFKHKKYMNTRVAKFYLSQTWKGTVVKAVNKITKFLNTEVNPSERKRMKEEAIQRRAEKNERRERKAQQANKAAARRAFNIAH